MTTELFKVNDQGYENNVEQPLFQMSEEEMVWVRGYVGNLVNFTPIIDEFDFGEDKNVQCLIDMVGFDENDRFVIIHFKRPGDLTAIRDAIYGSAIASNFKNEFEALHADRYGVEISIDTTDPLVVCVGMFTAVDMALAKQCKIHIVLHTIGSNEVHKRGYTFDNRVEEENAEREESEKSSFRV